MRPGYLYALSNAGTPDLIKVGCTTRSPFDRARELRSTGVPHPFVVLAAVAVPDIDAAEAAAFAQLRGRVDGREFFRTSLREVLTVFTTLIGDSVPARSTPAPETLLEQAQVWHHGAGTVAPDLKRAEAAYAEAAAAGSVEACRILAQLYAGGQGLRRNPQKVTYYTRRVQDLTLAHWQALSESWEEDGPLFVTALQDGDHHRAYLLAARHVSIEALTLVQARAAAASDDPADYTVPLDTLKAAYETLPPPGRTLTLEPTQ